MTILGAGPRRGVGRRTLLAGSGAAALLGTAGCSWLDRTPEQPAPETHPDRARLVAARDGQESLLAAVRATAAAHAGLATGLASLSARSEERLTALDTALGDDPSAAPPSPASPSSSVPPPASPSPAVPGRTAAAVTALITQTRAAEAARTTDCVAAADAGVARLLGALAAGYAQDVVTLRGQRSAV
ncbi:hypothetical protein [Mumia zhuanghuii]|uniref:DUF4439 domain-containing protein n=1 Tax=Mumia zhuanghuii TaxID=2585211 RepID=A0A5C4MFW1_9ACTN|nr:hypothetical protein [Mumia zhuanghuii]TNC35871.1 hypothetical protein FHE65_26685 [Mumia zhuanghuii]